MLVVLTCCGFDERGRFDMLARDSLNLKQQHSLLKHKKSNPNFPHDGEYLLPLVRSLFRMLACFLKSETRSACVVQPTLSMMMDPGGCNGQDDGWDNDDDVGTVGT